MNRTIKAIFRDGAFVPTEACDLPENAQVEIRVHGPVVIAPRVTDPDERERILRDLVERMRRNPWPAEVVNLSREILHERR